MVLQIPRDEEGEPLYEDFICKACSMVCYFLLLYPSTIWAVGGQTDASVTTSKDKAVLEDITHGGGSTKPDSDTGPHPPPNRDDLADDGSAKSIIGESSQKDNNSSQCTSHANSSVICVLEVDAVVVVPSSDAKPIFISKKWRDALCRCQKCLYMYRQKNISTCLTRGLYCRVREKGKT
ncbi:hypothetical protein SLE2022_230360 [Rubroshorea leprosula]